MYYVSENHLTCNLIRALRTGKIRSQALNALSYRWKHFHFSFTRTLDKCSVGSGTIGKNEKQFWYATTSHFLIRCKFFTHWVTQKVCYLKVLLSLYCFNLSHLKLLTCFYSLSNEGRGAMRPWTPQYPVRTQVVSRTLSEPRKRLVEPRKRLFLFKFFFLIA